MKEYYKINLKKMKEPISKESKFKRERETDRQREPKRKKENK